jgi:signal transduction histidine kinase/CheY-like chemotaxis protein/HPt (histidine-containing phosphotransfer) domain-containing protein
MSDTASIVLPTSPSGAAPTDAAPASAPTPDRSLLVYSFTGSFPAIFAFAAGISAIFALLTLRLHDTTPPPWLVAWAALMIFWAPLGVIGYFAERRAASLGSWVGRATVLVGTLVMALGWGVMMGLQAVGKPGLDNTAVIACAAGAGFACVTVLASRRRAWLAAWVTYMLGGGVVWWWAGTDAGLEGGIPEGVIGIGMLVLGLGLEGLLRDLRKMQAVEWQLRAELVNASGRLREAERRCEEMDAQRIDYEKELRSVREKVEAANRAKTEFLATMSHEIRTPLNGIMPILEILKDSKLDSEQKGLVKTAVASSHHLLRIINDILDFAKVESGKLELESVEFNLRDLVHSITDLMGRAAEQRGLKLGVVLADDVPLQVRGDPIRLRQVLTNLLSNAIKFTERGGIRVEVERRRSTRREVELLFSVSDTGIGIPAETARRLFQSFTQADASTTRKHGGTGLGLAICKRLVELMGGRIGVRSKEGSGSTFMFVIPLRKSVIDVPSARTDLEGVRALVFCKDPEHEQRLIDALTGWGVNFQRANNMVETLNKLTSSASLGESWAYEILVIDTEGMEQMALTLVREVRANAALAQLRIVGITGSAYTADELRAAGNTVVIEQPFNAGALRQTLNRLLDVQTRGMTAPHPTVPAPAELWVGDEEGTEEPPPRAIEPAPAASQAGRAATGLVGRVLLVEDNPVNLAVARKLIARLGLDCDSARDGREAVDAVQRSRYDVVLMDCQMPEMDGYEATQEIRVRESVMRRPRLPIVAMTANAMAGDRERCVDAGMDDYIAKPLDIAQLTEVLKRWIRPAEGAEAPPPVVAKPGGGMVADRGDRTVLDQKVLNDLREVVEEEFGPILRGFIDHAPVLQADLDAGLAAGDVTALVRPAHSLKSSSANVGAMQLSELARNVEHAARQGDMETAAQGVVAIRAELPQVIAALQPLATG